VVVEVKKMIIGHFSARYSDLQFLLAEAAQTFPNTELAIDGTVYSIS
jgi:ribonuclease Z